MSDAEKTQLSLRDIVDLEAWLDPTFKDQLQQDPAPAMQKLGEKYGMEIPAGIDFRVLSDSDKVYHLVLSSDAAGEAPASAESEVSGYMDMIAAPTTDVSRRGSTSTLFCNPAICKAILNLPKT
jgi:hypothetical protein